MHLKVPDGGRGPSRELHLLEQGVAGIFHFDLSFPSFHMVLPTAEILTASLYLALFFPGHDSSGPALITLGSLGPGSQPQLLAPLLPSYTSAKKLLWSPQQCWSRAASNPGTCPARSARPLTRNSHRVNAPHCPAHLVTWSRKWPHFLLLAVDGNNWEDDRRSPHRSPCLCQQRLFECGLYVACVYGMLLCVCVCVRTPVLST